MKRILAIAFAALAALGAAQAQAAPAAVVEGVQMPAWVERASVGAISIIRIVPRSRGWTRPPIARNDAAMFASLGR